MNYSTIVFKFSTRKIILESQIVELFNYLSSDFHRFQNDSKTQIVELFHYSKSYFRMCMSMNILMNEEDASAK